LYCIFIDSAKEHPPKAVSENPTAKSKKRKEQSVEAKPSTDEILKKRKKKKVMLCHLWFHAKGSV